MRETLDTASLARWRSDPIAFVEHVLCNPETGRPFVLSEAERWFLKFAFTLDERGRLKYPELVFGAIKKSGKTTLAAIVMLTMILLYGGRFAEGFCVANDLEQAQSRVFAIVKRIIEASPLLRAIAKLTADRVTFLGLDATIIAIASDAASAAGANPVITTFDELWGYVSERSRRLWDEMITSPARRISCRLTVSYAGFSGESVLLEELHKRGMALPELAPRCTRAMIWASRARACCLRNCISGAWRCPRLAPRCTRATACCSRGTPSRSRRGRMRHGSLKCGARCGRVLTRA